MCRCALIIVFKSHPPSIEVFVRFINFSLFCCDLCSGSLIWTMISDLLLDRHCDFHVASDFLLFTCGLDYSGLWCYFFSDFTRAGSERSKLQWGEYTDGCERGGVKTCWVRCAVAGGRCSGSAGWPQFKKLFIFCYYHYSGNFRTNSHLSTELLLIVDWSDQL